MANFHYRILVVDDDERIRMVSEQVLSSHDYEVRTASHGFEALALMRNALPDLIISDLNMPNMSGFELLSVVRRRFPQLPVIAISGEYSTTTSGPEGLLADAFFHKGQYSPAQLFTEIRSLLERSPIPPYLFPCLKRRPKTARAKYRACTAIHTSDSAWSPNSPKRVS